MSLTSTKNYNIDWTLRALQLVKNLCFIRVIKRRKNVFYCFAREKIYIIKQMKKPKPCITL